MELHTAKSYFLQTCGHKLYGQRRQPARRFVSRIFPEQFYVKFRINTLYFSREAREVSARLVNDRLAFNRSNLFFEDRVDYKCKIFCVMVFRKYTVLITNPIA